MGGGRCFSLKALRSSSWVKWFRYLNRILNLCVIYVSMELDEVALLWWYATTHREDELFCEYPAVPMHVLGYEWKSLPY